MTRYAAIAILLALATAARAEDRNSANSMLPACKSYVDGVARPFKDACPNSAAPGVGGARRGTASTDHCPDHAPACFQELSALPLKAGQYVRANEQYEVARPAPPTQELGWRASAWRG
jgi:hypothetical protein